MRFEDVRVLILAASDRRPGSPFQPNLWLVSPCRAGQNVRNAGEDVSGRTHRSRSRRGHRTRAVGLLAALNQRGPGCPPTGVAILATGDELIGSRQRPQTGQIRNSNSYMIVGMMRQCGGEIPITGIAHDTEHDIIAGIPRGRSRSHSDVWWSIGR